ncbi:MAG: hypothetical protein PQ612_03600 [Rickettsiales bacterium]|nr:hypothetical protein [Pseudomonadota bacterium]MDA0966302.1 hypothetical protein [Pseudomonadota bacterium]MDG4543033.1 hypothetical protein [Rickettsiales bacterium]MDG4545231.1 hypothetical protein [Rickettsiales bacterium]MDG4547680.1 hypothetical protein [Rickettsiales bacterium]
MFNANYYIILFLMLLNVNGIALASELLQDNKYEMSKLNELSDCPRGKFGEICDEYILSSDTYDIKTEEQAENYLNGEWEVDLNAFSREYHKKNAEKIMSDSFILSVKSDAIRIKFKESNNEEERCNASAFKVSYSQNEKGKGTVYANSYIEAKGCHWKFLVKDENRLVLTAYDFFLPMRRVQ